MSTVSLTFVKILQDPGKQSVKVSLLGAGALPPVDIAGFVSATSEKRADGSNIVKLPNGLITKARSGSARPRTPKGEPSNPLNIDLDNSIFPDFNSAYDALVAGIVSVDDYLLEKEKHSKEKKKTNPLEVECKSIFR